MKKRRPEVAILGGGIQGCCIALTLAGRGIRVTLVERQSALVSGTSANNEGKIHLGYVYAGDPSMDTARMMIRGALAFSPFFETVLERRDAIAISTPFLYAVHRESQVAPDAIAGHMAAVQREIEKALGAQGRSYFGIRLQAPERLAPSALERAFDASRIRAAFRTSEIAVNPVRLCDTLRARVLDDPGIDVRCGEVVREVVDDRSRFRVDTDRADRLGPFDHVVNASWAGRLSIDARRGLLPKAPWLHRVKFGFRFRANAMTSSTTVVLGPFGDTVAYEDGVRYLSWYPAGLRATGSGLEPPSMDLSEDECDAMRERSFAGLASIVPQLAHVSRDEFLAARPCGGVITARARTGIDDPHSELHARSAIGVTSVHGYHSVDTGKFTMAPYFAMLCADRIANGR